MAQFRCYCRDDQGRIVARHDIDAPDLDAAIAEARRLCGTEPLADLGTSEIWQDGNLVYPRPGAGPGRSGRDVF
jgi:hypothetical protein